MTETTEFNTEQGTCIGCRLPWNGESASGCCRNAVLVIADDAGMEVTEILLPINKDEQKILAETEISTGQSVRAELIPPLEQSMPEGQIISADEEIPKKHANRVEMEITVEQSTPGGLLTPVEPEIPKEHSNRVEPKITAEQPTPGGQRTPAEPEIPKKHANREESEITAERSTPGGQHNKIEPENPTKHSNLENKGVAEVPDIPVKQAAPERQMTQDKPEILSGPEIIIGVRI